MACLSCLVGLGCSDAGGSSGPSGSSGSDDTGGTPGNGGGTDDANAAPSSGGAASAEDMASLVSFDDVATVSSDAWLDGPRIVAEGTGVTMKDMVGTWAWATGTTAVAFVDASGDVVGTKGQGAYVTFEFFENAVYRIRIFTVQANPCTSISKEVQVGTYSLSGSTVSLKGAYDRFTASICGAAWDTRDYPPKSLSYQVTAARFVDLTGTRTGTGGVLHGACADSLIKCYSGYADLNVPSAPGYNLQHP